MGRNLGGTCGWRCLTCRSLQRFKRLPWLAACLNLASFLNGLNFGNFNVSLTSLEKRYQFNSQQSGMIATSSHIGLLSAILFVSHFGARSHKPRILAIGTLICAVGAGLRALPHFLEGPYQYSDTESSHSHREEHPICRRSNVTERTSCPRGTETSEEKSPTSVTVLLVIGQLLGGAGYSPMASLAPLIFEESMGGAHTPVFIAISNSISAIGIACGYLLGALSLQLFVDIGREVHIDSRDPRWVGAWWLLFVVTACLLALDSLLLFAFPARIPSKENLSIPLEAEEQISPEKATLDYLGVDSFKPEGEKRSDRLCSNLIAIPKSVWKLVRIPAFTLLTLTAVVEMLLFATITSFGPKLIEEDFLLTASKAGLTMGFVATIGGGGGTLGGGLLLRKYRLGPQTVAKLCSLSAVMAASASLCYVFYCQPPALAGQHVPYKRSVGFSERLTGGKLEAACNAGCHCQLRTFSPVCGSDGLTYFSPCHAGCVSRENATSNKFTKCRCVGKASFDVIADKQHADMQHVHKQHLETHRHAPLYARRHPVHPQDLPHAGKTSGVAPPSGEPGEVSEGRCGPAGPCREFYVALPFLVVGVVLRSLMITPLSMLILRCVPLEEKAVGLGLQWLCVKLFGTIPGPVLLGTVIDSACAVWQTSCSGRGQCWVYNMADLNLRLGLFWSLTSVASAVICFMASRRLSDVSDTLQNTISISVTPPLKYVAATPASSDEGTTFMDSLKMMTQESASGSKTEQVNGNVSA